jgi:hypothetical protein
MEIIDSEEDEYKWLDAKDNTKSSFAQRNTVKMISFSEGKWIMRPKHNIVGSNTLFVYYGQNGFHNIENLNDLFEIAESYNIRRIIFNKFIFLKALWNVKFVDSLQELVFNNCSICEGSYGSIFADIHTGNTCNLKKFILRHSLDITHDIKTININIPYKYHKLRTIKLINCKIQKRNLVRADGIVDDFTPQSEYTKEGNEDFQKAIAITKKYLDNNNNGYRKCQQVCLTLLCLKRYRLCQLFVTLDPNVLMIIVRMIWITRYENFWYESIDPYGDSSFEEI